MAIGVAWVNAGLAFLLELVALGVLAWGGWRLGGDGVLRVVLAVGLPVAAAVLWAVFAAPHATVPSTAGRLAVQVAVLGGAALVLAVGLSPRWGGGLAALVAVNLVLAALLPTVGTTPAG
ncbi:YrdB family protein [Modestobacter sp. URMC 112]